MPLTDRYEYSLSSPNGDCSIILKNLTFSRDNGVWQCQVPSAELDGAKWPKTSVVVLVKPSAPRFKEDVRKPMFPLYRAPLTSLFCRVLILVSSLLKKCLALCASLKVETRCLQLNGTSPSMARTLHSMLVMMGQCQRVHNQNSN